MVFEYRFEGMPRLTKITFISINLERDGLYKMGNDKIHVVVKLHLFLLIYNATAYTIWETKSK